MVECEFTAQKFLNLSDDVHEAVHLGRRAVKIKTRVGGGFHFHPSKQGLKSGGAKVPVIREHLADAQSPHDHEGNVIHNAGGVRLASLIILPRQFPIRFGRPNERSGFFKALAQIIGVLAKSPSRHGIATFKHHEGGGQQDAAIPGNFIEGRFGRFVPLIAFASQGEQADRIHEYQAHG